MWQCDNVSCPYVNFRISNMMCDVYETLHVLFLNYNTTEKIRKIRIWLQNFRGMNLQKHKCWYKSLLCCCIVISSLNTLILNTRMAPLPLFKWRVSAPLSSVCCWIWTKKQRSWTKFPALLFSVNSETTEITNVPVSEGRSPDYLFVKLYLYHLDTQTIRPSSLLSGNSCCAVVQILTWQVKISFPH